MRYFTVDEARGKLPEVRKVFALCKDIRARAQGHVDRLRKLEADSKSSPADAAIERGQVEFLAGCLEHALKGLEDLGVVLKGLDPALIDFPHRLENGKEVYLCWREGEEDITHYHSMSDGFAGRKPLPRPPVRH
ncbi:MAG: DUF2203 domain-containing protein [Elusimicrobia bacterium]|nr:DUF2203 domain-containing protein [Elusimicrobiota bacterium]